MADFSIRMTPLYFRLTLFQTQCDSYRENRFTLAVGAWISHYTGHYFIYLGQSSAKREASSEWFN